MDLAREADNKINAHEDLCAERYKNINESLSRIMKLIGWGGSFLAVLIVGLLGWSLNNQVEANKDAIQVLTSRGNPEPLRQYVPAPMQQTQPSQPTQPTQPTQPEVYPK